MPARPLRLAFVGFGNVGRRFAELLGGPYGRILRRSGISTRVTAIATGHHGLAVDARGLPLTRALALVHEGHSLAPLHRGKPVASTRALIATAPYDVLLELSPLEPLTGEPATAHVAAALKRGLHVITANKGPVAHAYGRLTGLARRNRVRFLHEGAVMDGFPIFNLAERCLRGVEVRAFRGVLNSTTTRILSRMEADVPFDVALAEAQAAGVAEADPAFDLDGWDAAVKACAVANALMGATLRPADVERVSVRTITAQAVAKALLEGKRWRLVARAGREGRRVRARVAPEELPLGDLLVSDGADGVLVLDTDLMGEVGLAEGAGGVDQTAYAVLSDLLEVASPSRRRSHGSWRARVPERRLS
jgi:homoserine dehydrogenase